MSRLSQQSDIKAFLWSLAAAFATFGISLIVQSTLKDALGDLDATTGGLFVAAAMGGVWVSKLADVPWKPALTFGAAAGVAWVIGMGISALSSS